ncbi:MAG: signal recognition particle-docking protein FtsY [Candidatus Thalassarchaeaceae archaeon]|uniref:Signal recognition particle receptor FtsY n=1 Tax=uncultured marine group II/III euryarchaeote KM3_172_F11 TaxID=1457929 RepID=A0A075GRA2_9EURY|nr:signal recognition particle-docking protein (ftsY) [uncultured marine group II/III euryarchaeote KM3_172_F11]MDC0149474.1 signal recognition particle-docking protein FtsY [Candidatus Poseidoniales archaeon]
MGLFDRFKKKAKEAVEEENFTVEEDSIEAEEALIQRRQLMDAIERAKKATPPPPPPGFEQFKEEVEEQWDEFVEELPEDPFSAPADKKSRKKAERAAAVAQAEAAEEESEPPEHNPMRSTTGRELVASEAAKFEIDLSDVEVKRGGRVIAASQALENILEELETDLLMADMGHDAVSDVMTTLRGSLIGARLNRKADLNEVIEKALRASLLSLLQAGYWDFDKTVKSFASQGTPVSIMMVGVNGTGKTTTSAKIANRLKNQGYSVVLAAADTFRAGAIDQLANHAERLGVRCIRSQRGGDAAAVARDAVESATARGEDIVIIDTAGRMQNKINLMEELRKVHRVTRPHLVLFVADALAGNDAVVQAREFQRMLSFDGAVLCKLDTDAKGGAALSISHTTGRPIVLAGVGQGYDDLRDFDPDWLIDSILATDE